MEPSSAALALRESFGDRKPIDISRKITACVACRKLKIRCDMSLGKPPCTRCDKRNLSCVVNRSLQMLLENDVAWKANVEQKLQTLEEAINRLNQQSAHHGRDGAAGVVETTPLINQPAESTIETVGDRAPGAQEQGWEIVMDLNRGPGVIPASVVSELAVIPPASRPNETDELDLIGRGIISIADAQVFFDLYYGRLDHYLYSILADHVSLLSVRKSSTLLTAAVCAVGALHLPSPHYQKCYQQFVQLASSRMFSKNNSHDDVRALCIGAFWLSDISWNLLGTAARLAGELNLHRCIPKAPHTKRACYLRTRLYYLVYICDHHFSIAYGRPPLTRDFSYITPPTEFLRSEFATEDDARLVSQIEIWNINTRVFDQFSLDPEAYLSKQLIPQLRVLSNSLREWRERYTNRFPASLHIGRYAGREVDLHYHFAMLFLCSHVFRKAPPAGGEPPQLAPELREFADIGVGAASSILRAVASDKEIQSYFRGLPAYFNTMIAFAFVFLLRVIIKDPAEVLMDKVGVTKVLEKSVTALDDITKDMHSGHLLTSVARSTRKLLGRFGHHLVRPDASSMEPAPAASVYDLDGSLGLWDSPTDAMFLEQFDFLNSPDSQSWAHESPPGQSGWP